MTAQALSIQAAPRTNLRRFDIRRDLLAVADLVELCFKDTLDDDGRLYIEQMRRSAHSGPLAKLASSGPNSSLPMGGFVWVDRGRLVGNLSLIEHKARGGAIQLIANVAVHPEFRRQGIARALTQAALEAAERRHSTQIWLQVDEHNAPAVNLYRGMGFREEARRTSWRAQPQQAAQMKRGGLAVGSVRRAHWQRQKEWLAAIYPSEVRWNLPFDEGLLDPGWRGGFERLFSERAIQQWAALRGRQLLGVLSWQSSSLSADRLWLALPSQPESEAIQALAQHAFEHLSPQRELALNLPTGLAADALDRSGFEARRTLIWMRLQK